MTYLPMEIYLQLRLSAHTLPLHHQEQYWLFFVPSAFYIHCVLPNLDLYTNKLVTIQEDDEKVEYDVMQARWANNWFQLTFLTIHIKRDSPPSQTRNRRYIYAKRQGKYTKIGYKRPHQRTIYHAKSTTYVVSSIEARTTPTQVLQFDSGSFVIGVDNHASRCITNNMSHFITPPSPTTNAILKGAGGKLQVKGQGTIRCQILDNSGRKHSNMIHNALYVPGLDICVLSPQHWSQQADDNAPLPDGTWCGTYNKSCVLHWDQQRFRQTVSFDCHRNTPKILQCF